MTQHLSSVTSTLLLHGHRNADDDDGVQFGYPMQPGETLDDVAATLRIPLSDLLADNPGLQPGMLLQPGLEISVPNQYLGQIIGNPDLVVAPTAMSGQNGFDMPLSNAATFINPDSSSYAANGYSANVLLPNSAVSNPNASFVPGLSPAASLGLPGSYAGNGTTIGATLSQLLFGSSTSSGSNDPFGLLNPLSLLLPSAASSAGYGSMPSWLGTLDPAGEAPSPLSFAQAASLVAQTLQPSAGSLPATSSVTALAAQAVLANGSASAPGTGAQAAGGTMQTAAATSATTGNGSPAALNNPAQAAAATRTAQANVDNVTVPNAAQSANAARTTQAQRDPNLPPPPPMPPSGENRFNVFGTATPLPNAAAQPTVLSAWNAVAGVVGGGNQAKLEIMALLATQAGSNIAGGVTAPAGNGQMPGFIDPMALAAYAAAMRGGRTINLGGGRALQFNVVADRLGRIQAIGDEERGASAGTRRTGDGLDGVTQDDELDELDEKAQERHEERNRERRRLAAVAAMRRRRRPLSARCRYRQGERRPLRDPGCGRYPRGIDLVEFSSRLPPRYLWTASPRRSNERPDKA